MKINRTKDFTLIPRLVLLSFFHLSLVCYRKSVNGFTVDLIHRDSPLSPFYNPSSTPSERLQNAFHWSFSRASFFNKNLVNAIQSSVTPTEGEFIMKISIGTPPVDTFVTLDTGSDLTWIQCEPCVHCFAQLGTPIFDPKKSSTYFQVDCENLYCQDLLPITCIDDMCHYNATYSDNTHSIGELGIETLTFTSTSGENVPILYTFFGCGHDNGDQFPVGTSGIIGLGRGDISIVNQMNDEIKGKFSYCLASSIPAHVNVTSRISFGDSAVVSGPGVVSTPLIRRESLKSFYFLTLESISVGDKNLPFISSTISSNDQGNIFIDSGNTLTHVPSDFYASLEEALVASISAPRIDDPTSGHFKVCYASDLGTINAPKIVAHFTNADVELSPVNVFKPMDTSVICFAMVPTDGIPIYGNLAQMDFLIGYDLVANQLSFLRTDDCSKL
ncbi:hypothetical protein BC332_20606 [Capsicum chinense]|nr:hypothetical protein BC332_20606 [Capsicum chinense]